METFTENNIINNTHNEIENQYKNLVSKMVQGFAFHKIILNESGKPIDYVFLEINESFEKITGLKRNEIIGKTIKEVIPNIETSLIDKYGEIALTAKPIQIEQYVQGLGKYFSIVAYSPEKMFFATIFTDISEIKEMENELRESEKKFKAIAAYTANWESWFDNKGRFLWVNPQVEAITGYTAEEILNNIKKFSDLIYKDDLIRVAAKFRSIIQGVEPAGKDFEFRCVGKNGNIFWLSVNWQQIFDDEGNSIGVRTSAREITEERQSYELIKLLNTAVEQSPVSIFITDNSGKIIFVNKKFSETTGYSFQEVKGKSPSVLKSGCHSKDFYDNLWNTIKSGKEWSSEVKNKKKDGKIFWEKEIISPIFDENNQITHYVAVKEDIDQKKASETQIKMLAIALDNIEAYVFIKDLDGKYIYANLATLHLFNTSLDKLVGTDDSLYFNEETYLTIKENDLDTINSLEITKNEEILILNNSHDELVWLTLRSPKYNSEGLIEGIYCVATDITERKNFEKELIELNEQIEISRTEIKVDLYRRNLLVEELEETKRILEKTNSEKDKFFSIIAHDLRSPFNGFLGLTKMLSENINIFDSDDVQEISLQLYESASNLYKLLENLLEWSRIQRGLTQFNPEYCDLNMLVNQNFQILKEFANQKSITFAKNIPEGCEVYCDVSMLNTVLRNLISNAIKFTPRNGQIIINGNNNERNVLIQVKDSGIGISSEMIDKLFLIDQKISRQGTEGEPSTGLGLLLCKEFIEKHSGNIWVTSEVGQGSSFFFTLPYPKKQLIFY